MNSSAISRVAANALPALSGASLSYSSTRNLWVTAGYTSAAGNFYNKGVRFSDRLAVHYDIGNNVFLNGITLYAWDGRRAVIIGRKEWGGYDNYCFYSEDTAKYQTILMLKNYLRGQAKAMGQNIGEGELDSFARRMVDDMYNYSRQAA